MTNFKLIFKSAFRDLLRQKIRTSIGVLGVTISVALLATVLFLADSISIGFIDYLSIDAGNQDLSISVRHYNGEPINRSSFFLYDSVSSQIKSESNEIGGIFPRMEINGILNTSIDYDTNELTKNQEKAIISGINFSLENRLNFGLFTNPNNDLPIELYNLSLYECAIYYEFNEIVRYSSGDQIPIEISIQHGNLTIEKAVNLTVNKIFDYKLKWPAGYRNDNLIIVNIQTLYKIFGEEEFQGRCNKLIITFRKGNQLYDIRDIPGSKKRVLNLAANIQTTIGLEEYSIELPKLEILEFAEMLSVIVTVIFIFVCLIAMLISGILINGILKTSVEERIREFGIFRTLGAHKSYNLFIVLLQGFLLCNAGSFLGIIGGLFGTQILVFLANNFILSNIAALGGAQLIFTFTWVSVIIAYAIGVIVGLVVSISPAIKVMRLQIIESIHPYRHEDTLYHLQKKSTVNYKLIITGIILSLNGAFVYLVVPRILISSNMTLFAGVLIVILLIFLIGITLAGLGIIPLLLRLVIIIFKPISRKLHRIISIFVHRYQRRNTSTIVIFALSFSFVMFTSIVVNGLSSQVIDRVYLQYGSDLVIETEGWEEEPISFQDYFQDEFGGGGGMFMSMGNEGLPKAAADNGYNINPDRIMTMDFKEKLLMFNGIEKVSSSLANPFQLTQIYSENGEEFTAEIGDYAGLSTEEISLIAVDQEFSYSIHNQYMMFTQGNTNEAFNDLFLDEDYVCIISEAIATDLNLNLGDLIRILIQRGDELQIYPFKIIGVVATMPGFDDYFERSARGAKGGGVLISNEVYIDIMEIPTNTYVNRFFIKLRENANINIGNLIDQINERYESN
ncbi:MAG: ABC transporter permease, partial [Promethearchaeota archaeon]